MPLQFGVFDHVEPVDGVRLDRLYAGRLEQIRALEFAMSVVTDAKIDENQPVSNPWSRCVSFSGRTEGLLDQKWGYFLGNPPCRSQPATQKG